MSCVKLLKEVKVLENALNCKVCEHLLVDPLLIAKCGHTVCKQCLADHTSTRCPVCNVPVNTRDSLEDKQLKDLLLHLQELKSLLLDSETLKDETMEQEMSASTTPKTSSRISSALSSSGEENIVQETPENQTTKKNVTNSISLKKRGRKKPSMTETSPSSSVLSPAGNINKKNHKGETLLHRAVIKGDIRKVTELLKEGAQVNTLDNNGWTPLHEASNHGFVEMTKLLLEHGALVNVPSLKDNIMPLHDALLNNEMPVAILLASKGADLHAKTSSGYTALDLCKTDEDRKILTEACSPYIQANTLIPDVKACPKQFDKLVFLPTNLNETQKQQLQKCAQLLKADIVEDFKAEVTHVVTSCDNMGNCVRTMKILLGILSGKWLMNFEWIEVCLEYKEKLEEEMFEVQGTKNQPNTQGPKRARQNREQKFPPLFDGFYFYLHGVFTKPTPEREDILNLLHAGGARILTREPRSDTVCSDEFLIPFHASGTPLEDTNHIILFQERPPRDVHVCSSHIATTQVMWLIACISEFRLLEFKQTTIPAKK